MKLRNVLGGLIALTLAGGVQAQVSAAGLAGTWECFGPDQNHPKKPPIVWFGDAQAKDGALAQVDIDGFFRAVSGAAAITAEADGVLKVAPAVGETLYLRSANRGQQVSMTIRREGIGEYRCYRLPKYDDVLIPRKKIIEEKS